ncbi:MAG: helix-turn-helix transcriptional regulator [Candidatus Thorarchaeota archaeon]
MSVTDVIVNRIKELRELELSSTSNSEDWTQEGLARRLGVTRQTIISIEKGSYNPSLLLAFKISRIFEMKIEEIFEYRDDKDAN